MFALATHFQATTLKFLPICNLTNVYRNVLLKCRDTLPGGGGGNAGEPALKQ